MKILLSIRIDKYQLELINMLPQSFWVFQRKFIYKESLEQSQNKRVEKRNHKISYESFIK